MIGQGLKYGKGVFETVLVLHGTYHHLEDHLRRMEASLAFLGISYPHLAQDLAADQARRSLDQGAYRFMVVEEAPGQGRLYTEVRALPQRPVRLRGQLAPTIRDSNNPLNQHKTNNYLANLLALDQARAQGYDEVFFLNERGSWTEGAMSNLFFVQRDRVLTPPVEDGLLPGIQRQLVLDRLGQWGVDLEVRSIPQEEIRAMDGAFATNSLMQVKEIEALGQVSFAPSPQIRAWIQDLVIK